MAIYRATDCQRWRHQQYKRRRVAPCPGDGPSLTGGQVVTALNELAPPNFWLRSVEILRSNSRDSTSRGLLLPGSFAVLAEEAGLVAAIGMVVLEPACADIQTNQRACVQLAGLRSIFLAANSMTRAGFGLSQGVA